MKGALAGRSVAIAHPAWHSCGTYSVVLGQAQAYRELGANVVTIACSDMPGFGPQAKRLWRGYRAKTPELDAQERSMTGVPVTRALSPGFLRDAVWPFLHGDQAAMRAGAAAAAPLPDALASRRFDLVHCNHFFCMPVARRLARGAPILLDTHDVQAAQFELINDARLLLPPRARYEDMLARELREMRDADAVLHLNADEDRVFRKLWPDGPHHLLYPPVPDVPTGPGGPDILYVSSWNAANLESALWFLREVMPRAGDPAIRIVGNIDAGVRAADPTLHRRYRDLFVGRVSDLAPLYARARLALLPTVSGTGLSIKTVEAMASGLPLLASPLAFRGMDFNPAGLANVTIANNAAAFAGALRDAASTGADPPTARRDSSDTRRFYEAIFSAHAYATKLSEIIHELLPDTIGRAT